MGYDTDWLKIRTEFIQGIREPNKKHPQFISFAQMAKRHKVPLPTLTHHALNEQWTMRRQEFIKEFEEAVKEKSIQKLSDKTTEFDNQCYNIAASGIDQIEEQMNFFKELNKSLTDENGNKKFLDLDYFDKASKAIERFQRIGRIALGLSANNNEKNPSYNNIKIVSFSEGLDKVMKQIRSNPNLQEKIEAELID
jgi:hypothetical protein